MAVLALISLVACDEDEPMMSAPPPPPPEPHEIACAGPAPLPQIWVGEVARAEATCTVSGGPMGQPITLTVASAPAPFFADLEAQATRLAGETLNVAVRNEPTEASDDASATVTVQVESVGQSVTATFAVSGESIARRAWDPTPPAPPCRADGDAPLLDRALMGAGLDRTTFGFGASDLMESTYDSNGLLRDEFVLSWFKEMRAQPGRSGCFEGQVAGALDRYLQGAHPVAGMIRHSAGLIDRHVDGTQPFDPRDLPGSFNDALNAICEVWGSACGRVDGWMPPELAEAIAPLGWAMHEGIVARRERDGNVAPRDPNWWTVNGGNSQIITTSREGYDRTNALDRAYLTGADRDRLYAAAAMIAHAIEDVDWSRFRGMTEVFFEQRTPAGWVRIRDANSQTYADDGEATLLLIDLGGDDVHEDDVASNVDADNAVSVVIDLDGADRYVYDERATPYDDPDLVPADDGLRYAGDENFGNISLSRRFRQGAARNGIAMLFDLGGADDHYQSLHGSQGYAHQGVGVLFDDGGADAYLAESNAQGSAQFGIGLLVDAGDGWDVRRAFKNAQGFGFSAGVGVIVDGGGDDEYTCNHGNPDLGGIRMYPSPQLPRNGNSSFCQGAGFGWRGEGGEALEYLSGGLGVLRDIDGNDSYEASVFGQGTGYWQGTGILSDGGGSDLYDAYWYVQGAAAHYAVGILADDGPGDDTFNATRPAVSVNLGSGHDYSVGVLINEAGNDEYNMTGLSAGSSNCNGVGLFVDNRGDDTYKAASDRCCGMGNVSGECRDTRPNAVSIGVMIDAGGADDYQLPAMSDYPRPTNTSTWGHTRFDLPSEHGSGIDDSGESGVHPER